MHGVSPSLAEVAYVDHVRKNRLDASRSFVGASNHSVQPVFDFSITTGDPPVTYSTSWQDFCALGSFLFHKEFRISTREEENNTGKERDSSREMGGTNNFRQGFESMPGPCPVLSEDANRGSRWNYEIA